MYLSDFQKQVVQAIASEKVTDIESFIDEFLDGKRIDFGGAVKLRGHKVFPKEATKLFLPNNVAETHKLCKEFKLLLIALQKNDFIVLIEKPQDEQVKINHFGILEPHSKTINHKLDDMLEEYFYHDIYSTSDLKNFLVNNFLTPQEIVIRDEKQDRINAQRWTIAIALITIIISSIINFQTNRKIEVKVVNPQDMMDTLYVDIIEKEPEDSTKLRLDLEQTDTLQVKIINK